jgi:signal transduction histidine kinase
MLYRQMVILFIFLGFFFLIAILIYNQLVTRILAPLALMKSGTEMVMNRNFKPIELPYENENEITDLFRAFNKMSNEIDTRCNQLVQSRKMASIGTFTSGIAHELNNPINNISLVAQAIIEDEDTMDPSERHALYQDLIEQSRRASDIVKNLLEFSRTSHHRQEDIDLETMVERTAALVKNEIRFQHITFTKEVHGELPLLYLEKNSFQQVFINLFLNAVQAIKQKGGKRGKIKVVLSNIVPTRQVKIEVIDNGIGIPADQIDEIFDPFFTSKKEGEGTGLGLSVTYNTIKKHKGKIEVQSIPGEGTSFTILLPIGVRHESAART